MIAEQTVLSKRHSSGRLIVQQGAQAGNTFFLKGASTILGREVGVDIVINDPECSRRHVRITTLPGGYTIEDLGSTNGTLLNGDRTDLDDPVASPRPEPRRFEIDDDVPAEGVRRIFHWDSPFSWPYDWPDVKVPYNGTWCAERADWTGKKRGSDR